MEKRAHVTLMIQAGADTTGTALGCILRFLLTDPSVLARARAEIETAEANGLLSTPIRYEETRQHLPFFVACIKEGLRLNPPATNLFARIAPEDGKVIDGHFVPGGTEITSHAYTVQRNKELYGEDAAEFKPERWMVGEKRNFELEAAQFTFGVGSRVCLGKDIAILEMYKLLPEVSHPRMILFLISPTNQQDHPSFRHRGRAAWQICCGWWGGLQCGLSREVENEATESVSC
jgi:cytochrome P450